MEKYNTKEKAYEYAKQFESRTEISKKDYKFYRFILKNGIIYFRRVNIDFFVLKGNFIKKEPCVAAQGQILKINFD